MERIQRWWTQRLLHRRRIALTLWRHTVEASPVLQPLDKQEQHRLRLLASLFLHHKVIVGAGGFQVNERVRGVIAAQASLLVLNLGLDWYRGWSEIIVYPGAFFAPQREQDEAGIVHESHRGLSGQAWGSGPVILSWEDIAPASPRHRRKGFNVVLHEFAHKLDFLDGSANGIPPLHPGNTPQEWARDFTRAYDDLQHHPHQQTGNIDPYATTSPAEFFAVMTEHFFEIPGILQQEYPAIYDELRRFYRQDPVNRLLHKEPH